MKFEKKQAELYLQKLDPTTETFCFYAFDPSKNNKPRVLEHRTLNGVWNTLCRLNTRGYGIYVAINVIPEKKSRLKKNISQVRALWQEDDDGWKGKLPIKPQLITETSPGKFHRYFLTKHTPVENGVMQEFEGIMRCMVEGYGSDKNVIDISRVLRLPGLYNTKSKKKKDWFRVQVVKATKKDKRYRLKKVINAFPAPVTSSIADDDRIHKTNTWNEERLNHIINIADANSYYEELLKYSMSLANRKFSRDEMIEMLLALLEKGQRSRPDQDMKIWEERIKQIPQFVDSAIKKVNEERTADGSIVDPDLFMGVARGGIDFILDELDDLSYAYIPKFLQLPSITMVHAARGLGKTFFNLSLGMSLALGADYLKWKNTFHAGRRVLYIDGEMTLQSIQENIKTLTYSFVGNEEGMVSKKHFNAVFNENFKLITIDDLPDKIFPDLTERGAQKALDKFIEDFDPEIIFFDNLSTIFKTAEDEQKNWQPVQDWLSSLRARSISSVLVHHDNKDGMAQRGFSKKEDIINYAIHLQKPPGYKADMGARFIVNFTKTRDLFGEGVKMFEARLEGAEFDDNGEVVLGTYSKWNWSEYSITTMEEIAILIKDGYGYNDICKELSITKGTISYNVKKCLEQGLLKESEVKRVQIKRMPRKKLKKEGE